MRRAHLGGRRSSNTVCRIIADFDFDIGINNLAKGLCCVVELFLLPWEALMVNAAMGGLAVKTIITIMIMVIYIVVIIHMLMIITIINACVVMFITVG